MSTSDVEALRRQLSDALAAYQEDDLLRLDGLVEEIEALGPSYRLHATLLRSALKKKDQAEAAVAAELIQVLDKLERGPQGPKRDSRHD
jgi:hypothetical protein